MNITCFVHGPLSLIGPFFTLGNIGPSSHCRLVVIYSLFSMSIIPDLPGDLVARNSDQERWLKNRVGRLCHMDSERWVSADFRLSYGSSYSPQLSRQSAS